MTHAMEPSGARRTLAHSLRPALLIALALFAAGCQKQAGPVDGVRAFFEQLAAGKVREAYASTAFGFQAGEDEKTFEAVVRDLGLADYASLETEPPKIEGNSATLHLQIAAKSGKQAPFVVTMTNETGAWRVFSIRSPRDNNTGVAENRFTVLGKVPEIAGTVATEPPDEKEVRRLIRQNLLAFDQAVADRSFNAFYATLSARWRDQITEGQLERAFQPFVEQQFRVAGVANVEAVLDQPAMLNGEGTLIVSGYYPTQPFKTVFNLKFIYELPKWKLFGIDVNLQKD